MVDQFGADDDVLDVHVVAVAAGTTAADNHIGVKLIDHTLCTEGGVHLTDAALLDAYLTVCKELLQLAQLLVHGYNNSYFHLFL